MAFAAGSMTMTAPRTFHPFFERTFHNEISDRPRHSSKDPQAATDLDEPSSEHQTNNTYPSCIPQTPNVETAFASGTSDKEGLDDTGSRKRRKLDNQSAVDMADNSTIELNKVTNHATNVNDNEYQVNVQNEHDKKETESSFGSAVSLSGEQSTNMSSTETIQRPNVLQLDGKGRFSSIAAVAKRKTETEPDSDPEEPKLKARRVRRRRAVVILKYGILDIDKRCEIGSKIQKLLTAPQPAPAAPDVVTPIKSQKSTHPFFSGKPTTSAVRAAGKQNKDSSNTVDKVQTDAQSPNKRSFTTPGKFKQCLRLNRPDLVPPVRTNAGLSRSFNLPGTYESPFPWQGIGEKPYSIPEAIPPPRSVVIPRRRARKNKPFHISADESLLSIFCQNLQNSEAFKIPGESKYNGPHILPRRLLISGHELQRLIRAQLAEPGPVRNNLDKLTSTLSAYDSGKCEQSSWLQKYAPQCAADVLQSASEVHILRNWLESLTIDAVHKGTVQSETELMLSSRVPKWNAKPRRRKPRKDEMDDFIVNSDDDDELRGIHSADELDKPAAEQSVVRGTPSSSGGPKTSRCMIISGPSGSGKTAAIYAVAKELGFEVFEINASSRRAGKDIIEKIGDMTFNHQVPKASIVVDDDKDGEMADELALDSVPESNQKSLTSFFGAAKKTVKPRPAAEQTKVPQKKISEAKPRKQKQSLILFEEVDALFEDDKQFWETVIALNATSKRPLILTCKDEALVPIDLLSPHGILRFKPCSIDLSAEYLLVVAALEGHLLHRKDVLNMLKSCRGDLRAAMTSLSFWCQIGVGDQKGGLDWMFQRWPTGIDLNERGDKLRVISEGTCPSGMSWMDYDMANDLSLSLDQRRERYVDFLTTNLDLDMSRVTEDKMYTLETDGPSNGWQSNNLLALEHFTRLRSTADIVCKVDLPGRYHHHESFDHTNPPMLESTRRSYISGYRLLQTDRSSDYSRTGVSLYSALHWGSIADANSGSDAPATMNSTLHHEFEKLVLDPKQECMFDRNAFSKPFEPIAGQPDPSGLHTNEFQQSSFDRNISLVATEIAPYVRCIAAYDMQLEEYRLRLSGAIDQSHQAGKRVRTTRASRSALEGSQRSVTRRERWFPKALDTKAVLRTGGQDWPQSSVFLPASTRESSVLTMETSSQEI